MKKTLLSTALPAFLIFNLLTSPAFSFNPDEYSYKEYPVSVDGKEMIVLRIYDNGQTVEFSAADLNSNEGDESKISRTFNNQDLANITTSMRYVKDVFGAPAEAPIIETFTDTEDNASFGSPVSITTGGISGTRLSTWFLNQEKNQTLPLGMLTIGDMGDKDDNTLYSLVKQGEGAAMSSVIVHEMMHGLGIATEIQSEEIGGENYYYAATNNSTFSSHLYDIYDHVLEPGMAFAKGPVANPKENTFYQYNNGANGGAYFWGEHVQDVLTVQGQTAEIAFPDGDYDESTMVSKVKGIPVNGYESDYDENEQRIEFPELSHLELQNSMMSHQNYRNWSIFMEAELAVLQDIGFTNIDRRRFFGFSVYNDLLTYTNTNAFDSDQDWALGLHVYGSYNTITQGADIETRGESAYGIRIDGQGNTLIVPTATKIQAKGEDGIGILLSYGNSHNLTLQGDVEATGSKGDALRFDFGGNLIGDGSEYRGSYFQVNKNDETGLWEDVREEDVISALDGPLAETVDISGHIVGSRSAIYISDNALVRQINILDGADITGDIISEWSSSKNRYGSYGDGMTLFKPEDEVDRTLLTFGFEADEDGNATQYADPDFDMTYAGNIIGADGFDVQLAGGNLTYSGNADVNILQTEEDTNLILSDSNIYLANLVGNGNIAAEGNNQITIKEADGSAQLENLTVNNQANIEINAATGEVEINTLENSGHTKFQSYTAQAEQITIDKYSGSEDSVLSLNLSASAANQLQGDTTAKIAQQGAQILAINDNETSSNLNLHIAEGDINGEINAVVDPEGQLLSASEKKNASANVIQDIVSGGFQVFRAQMNDLEKRMGDLRNMPEENGAWAKFISGQSKYKGMRNDYKTFQFGIDHRFSDFFVGLMGSHTNADGKIRHGSTDDKNYSYGLYGGWLGRDGQFVDVTLKHHDLKSDYGFSANGNGSKGKYRTTGFSSSIEYGWRLGIEKTNFYVEPQTEFLYGFMNGKTHTTSRGVRVRQSDIKSVVGRLGMAMGWLSPDKKGNIYIRVSVLNDWQGKSKITFTKDHASRRYNEDMGGTWGEFALGGTGHITENLSAYGEVETTTGSPIRTTYEFNAGLRFNF